MISESDSSLVTPVERPRTRLDNPPACGANKNWRWGFLPCGCHNDGYGNHVR